jgi:hypothetical protein
MINRKKGKREEENNKRKKEEKRKERKGASFYFHLIFWKTRTNGSMAAGLCKVPQLLFEFFFGKVKFQIAKCIITAAFKPIK